MKSGGPSGQIIIGGAAIGGTAGSVIFIGAGGKIAEDNSNFYWDDVENLLGVGMNTPYNQFRAHIKGSGSGMGPLLLDNVKGSTPTTFNRFLKFDDTTVGSQLGVISGSSDAMAWIAGNTMRFILETNTTDMLMNVGVSGVIKALNIEGTTGKAKFGNKIYPSTDAAVVQSVSGIYAGNGAPNNANGANGDFYFRGDGGGALTRLYLRIAGVWTGIV